MQDPLVVPGHYVTGIDLDGLGIAFNRFGRPVKPGKKIPFIVPGLGKPGIDFYGFIITFQGIAAISHEVEHSTLTGPYFRHVRVIMECPVIALESFLEFLCR